LRPTWRVAGAAALWLVLEWYGATSEISWLFLLGAWIAAVVLIAAMYASWNRGLVLHLELESSWPAAQSPVHELPEHVLRSGPYPAPIFEGDSFQVSVGLDTRGGDRGPAWVAGEVSGLQIRFGTGIVPRTGWRRSGAIDALRRAPISASEWTIHTSDPLGFFHGIRRCDDAELGLVLPKFGSLAARRQARELEAAASAPRAGVGIELFGVREYRAGDALRRIHWRSSARLGELVVREYEPPGVQSLAILVDPSPRSQAVADQVARIAASEAWDCIREGGRVSIWGPGLQATEPRQARDLWALLDWLARYPGPAGDDPAPVTSDVVMVTGSPDASLVEEAESSRTRGARARAWLIGDAELDVDLPVERAGVEWPL